MYVIWHGERQVAWKNLWQLTFLFHAGPHTKMLEWLLNLQQLVIPDGAVEGLSNADKPFLEGHCYNYQLGTAFTSFMASR